MPLTKSLELLQIHSCQLCVNSVMGCVPVTGFDVNRPVFFLSKNRGVAFAQAMPKSTFDQGLRDLPENDPRRAQKGFHDSHVPQRIPPGLVCQIVGAN